MTLKIRILKSLRSLTMRCYIGPKYVKNISSCSLKKYTNWDNLVTKNMSKKNIIVNFIIQKLKSKHTSLKIHGVMPNSHKKYWIVSKWIFCGKEVSILWHLIALHVCEQYLFQFLLSVLDTFRDMSHFQSDTYQLRFSFLFKL